MFADRILPSVLEQHSENAAFDWLRRQGAVTAPHYDLDDLAELDTNIEANMDGLYIAGEPGHSIAMAALESAEPGEVFVATLTAIAQRDGKAFDRILKAADQDHFNLEAVVSALGWVPFEGVESILLSFFKSSAEQYRYLALAGFAVHRQHPGARLKEMLSADQPRVRRRALRLVGELGATELAGALGSYFDDSDRSARFWATWSAARLGQAEAVARLQPFVTTPGALARRALELAMRRLPVQMAHQWLRGLAESKERRRCIVCGIGALGDPTYVPFLIGQMSEPELARVAGEAFTMITGLDLVHHRLDAEPPALFDAGPSDDPSDPNVQLDLDEDLSWPDRNAIQVWWREHGSAFIEGQRYLCGRPVTFEHCQYVLRAGLQRQRTAAALELALMNPAEPLFEVRMPGFRQKELLQR